MPDRALPHAADLVLAWDPDFTALTPAEAATLENAAREMDAGEYVTDSAINWD